MFVLKEGLDAFGRLLKFGHVLGCGGAEFGFGTGRDF